MSEIKYESKYTGEQIDAAVDRAQKAIIYNAEQRQNISGDLDISGDLTMNQETVATVRQLEKKSKKDKIVIEKIKEKKQPPKLKITPQINSDISLDTVKIFLQLKKRTKGYNRWWHPVNGKYGYGSIAGLTLDRPDKTETGGKPIYPSVPQWMPNKGFILTEFSAEGVLYLTQDYFQDLLKPIYTDEIKNWEEKYYILGARKNHLPLELRFILVQVKNNNSYEILATSEETIKIRANKNPIERVVDEEGKFINLSNFFIKIC